jgi:hypothetical protein
MGLLLVVSYDSSGNRYEVGKFTSVLLLFELTKSYYILARSLLLSDSGRRVFTAMGPHLQGLLG